MPDVILYQIPPSFYSQIARIVLVEKGVEFTSRFVGMDMYEPWYMRLHPGGTVPTMVHDGHPVPDSFAIARYVNATFEGPPLIPADEGARAEMERWIQAHGDISMRELSYGTGKMVRIAAMLNRYRIRLLKRHERNNPDMSEVYQAKQKDIQGFTKNFLDAEHMERIRAQVRKALDEMEEILAKHAWLANGSVDGQYTMADAFWTVMVARLKMISFDPLRSRPALADWYDRVKARPSFREAEIWESFDVSRIIKAVMEKYGLRLAVILLAIGGIWTLLWWLL